MKLMEVAFYTAVFVKSFNKKVPNLCVEKMYGKFNTFEARLLKITIQERSRGLISVKSF